MPTSPKPDTRPQWAEKTQLGRLFAEKEYSDPKSYRNQMDNLLKKADTYTIVTG